MRGAERLDSRLAEREELGSNILQMKLNGFAARLDLDQAQPAENSIAGRP